MQTLYLRLTCSIVLFIQFEKGDFMDINSIDFLALSIHNNKGVYALLLGSGISRAAGIMTGWEITVDLIEQLATLDGENTNFDPCEWYKKKYKKEPNYNIILGDLAKTDYERSTLVKKYFESSEDNDKTLFAKPTQAHKAIARLIKKGYFRIVITTNFDRLLESALAEVNIVPTVISTEDQIKGAMPLIHSSYTILKVNGDYMDTRIKNTQDELKEYSEEMNDYIDRVLDEFGLIVCGWSGEYDEALRNCIFRTKNRRFSCYWVQKGLLSKPAEELIGSRKYETIDIKDADSFFTNLEEKINSLEDLKMKKNPLSIDMACATMKRLLPDTQNTIRINDLVLDTAKELFHKNKNLDCSCSYSDNQIKETIIQLENTITPLIHLLTIGCYWGGQLYEKVWIDCFKLILNMNTYSFPSKSDLHNDIWFFILKYPALLLMYTIAISCIKSECYGLLYKILNTVKTKSYFDSTLVAASSFLFPDYINRYELFSTTLGLGKTYPVSQRVSEVLKEPIFQIVHNKYEYTTLFNKAEYFITVNSCYEHPSDFFTPGFQITEPSNIKKIENIFDYEWGQKDEWAAIKAGFFGNSFNNFQTCNNNLKNLIISSSTYNRI